MWSNTKYDVIRMEQSSISFNEAGFFREFIEDILNQENTHIIIDLSELAVIGSAGIGVLFSLAKKIKARDGNFKIIGVSHDVEILLKLAKIDQIIEIHQPLRPDVR